MRVHDNLKRIQIVSKPTIRVSELEPEPEPEPEYLAGAPGAVTLARLRFHIKYLFNNSRKLDGTYSSLDVFSKVNIK